MHLVAVGPDHDMGVLNLLSSPSEIHHLLLASHSVRWLLLPFWGSSLEGILQGGRWLASLGPSFIPAHVKSGTKQAGRSAVGIAARWSRRITRSRPSWATFSAAVINHSSQKHLTEEGFIWAGKLQSIFMGSQGRSWRQELK